MQMLRKSALSAALPLIALALLAGTGCRRGGLPFINLLGLDKPLVVALVTENPLDSINPFSPYDSLREALKKDLGREVAMDLCFPLQVESGLNNGFYQLAIVSPTQYAALREPEHFAVLAVATDLENRPAHSAVLIVAAGSPVRDVADLRGKRVAFGQTGDPRTHAAAVDFLRAHGLATTDLSLELLPIPGSLKHVADARALAREVLSGGVDAGFIDETVWVMFPEQEAKPTEPARDRFHVLGKTAAVPDRLVLASPKLDPATVDKVRTALLTMGEKHPEALKPLRFGGYLTPTPDVLNACRKLTPMPSKETRAAPEPEE